MLPVCYESFGSQNGSRGVTEQPRENQARKQWSGEQLSRHEFEFLQRWRELIDRVGGDGGQKRVARRLKWSTSTVSRDYAGITLPSDERLEELSDYLRLARGQRIELAGQLQRASAAAPRPPQANRPPAPAAATARAAP